MTGKELIKWIEDHGAEDEIIYYSDGNISIAEIDWEMVKMPSGFYKGMVIIH